MLRLHGHILNLLFLNNMVQDKFGLASLILGILAVIFMLVGMFVIVLGFLGFILMVLTFIFSWMQRKEHKNNLATIGLILGFIALAIFILDSVMIAQIEREKEIDTLNGFLSCNQYFFDEKQTSFDCEYTCKDVCKGEGFDEYQAEGTWRKGNCDCLCKGCKE